MASAVRVTVTAGATLLAQGDADGSTVLIRNAGSAVVDVGGEDVAAGQGFEVPAGGVISADLAPSEKLFAASAGPVSVHVLKNRA